MRTLNHRARLSRGLHRERVERRRDRLLGVLQQALVTIEHDRDRRVSGSTPATSRCPPTSGATRWRCAGRDTASSARCSTRAQVRPAKPQGLPAGRDATAETKSSLMPFPSFFAHAESKMRLGGLRSRFASKEPSHSGDLPRIVIMCARYAATRCATARGCEDDAFLPALVLAPGPGGLARSCATVKPE